jgi:uncharacterized protein (TIGR02145 family)
MFSKITLMAGVAVALAFTFNACDSGGGGGNSGEQAHVHDWGAWAVTTAATCEAVGIETRTCTGDNTHKETKEIAKLDWSAWTVKTPATPTEAGLETRNCPGDASTAQTRPLYPKCNGVEYDPAEKLCDDRDNKLYKYVTIGTEATAQTWMAENLNYNAKGSKCYAEGVSDVSADSVAKNCAKYGRLYDWPTAISGICPPNWHLPSDAEWTTLTDYVEGTSGCSYCAGRYLKSASGWNSYSGIVNSDNYGFSALPGGYGYSVGYFFYAYDRGYWWSTSEFNSSNAYYRVMYYFGTGVYSDNNDKSVLYSVRCMRDED